MIDGVIIDNKKYIEVDITRSEIKTYAYLVNVDDYSDFLVRIKHEDKYLPLKDEKEFELALMYFLRKHKKEIKEQ